MAGRAYGKNRRCYRTGKGGKSDGVGIKDEQYSQLRTKDRFEEFNLQIKSVFYIKRLLSIDGSLSYFIKTMSCMIHWKIFVIPEQISQWKQNF